MELTTTCRVAWGSILITTNLFVQFLRSGFLSCKALDTKLSNNCLAEVIESLCAANCRPFYDSPIFACSLHYTCYDTKMKRCFLVYFPNENSEKNMVGPTG